MQDKVHAIHNNCKDEFCFLSVDLDSATNLHNLDGFQKINPVSIDNGLVYMYVMIFASHTIFTTTTILLLSYYIWEVTLSKAFTQRTHLHILKQP